MILQRKARAGDLLAVVLVQNVPFHLYNAFRPKRSQGGPSGSRRWKIEDAKGGEPQTGRARSLPRITLITQICLIRVIREIRGGGFVEQREAKLLSGARRPRLGGSLRRKEAPSPGLAA